MDYNSFLYVVIAFKRMIYNTRSISLSYYGLCFIVIMYYKSHILSLYLKHTKTTYKQIIIFFLSLSNSRKIRYQKTKFYFGCD